MASSTSSSSSSSKGERKAVHKKLGVLIVVNEDIAQTAYILCLQKCGAETLGVRNGAVAVEIHDITQMCFDLILMSSTMPIMDGIEATKKLRSMGITTMIVGMPTQSDNEEYRKEFMEAGLDKCYEQPLTMETFQSLIEKVSNKV
ncbi:two-component response regulator ARR22-like [Capsicum galapagoense]